MPIVLFLLAVAVFAQGTSEFMLAGLLPGISSDLGVPLGRTGLLTSAFAAGMVLGAPAMAVLSRRFSPRWSLTAFLALFIAAHVVGALADGFAVLLLTRVAAAIANAGFLAVTMSTIVRIVPPERQARGLSVVLGGTTLALIAGVPGGALVGELLGWRATLWAVALLCVPAALGVMLMVPARPAASALSGPSGLRREFGALRRGPVIGWLLLGALVNAATFCTFTYLAPLALGPAGLPRQAVPGLLAVFGVGAFLGVAFAGRVADRHWRRLIGVAGPALLGGWLLLAAGAGAPAAVWVLAPVLGALSFALGSTLIARVVASAQSEAPTMAGAFATMALNVGAVAGPAVGGLFLDLPDARGAVLVSAAMVLVVAAAWRIPAVRRTLG
ncbi:Cmx/CmrA family chloramphenicol efflux MFS transporter [Microbacterium sp.]|uniref:Cmx/CmrA family chloramphenicol efflux MFS transporter n=1 Tax=Microbacterium sp. TaxID=51671 RepID=UPI00333E2D2B